MVRNSGILSEKWNLIATAGEHGRKVQALMERIYDLAGGPSKLLDIIVEQKEAFAHEACMSALQDATGIHPHH